MNSDAEFEIEDNEDHTALWVVMRKYLFRGSPKTRIAGKAASTNWLEEPDWTGSASEAMAKLQLQAATEFDVLGIKDSRKMGKLMGLLPKSAPEHVTRLPRTSGGRGYKIYNPDVS